MLSKEMANLQAAAGGAPAPGNAGAAAAGIPPQGTMDGLQSLLQNSGALDPSAMNQVQAPNSFVNQNLP